jgi:hypothetical protein
VLTILVLKHPIACYSTYLNEYTSENIVQVLLGLSNTLLTI